MIRVELDLTPEQVVDVYGAIVASGVSGKTASAIEAARAHAELTIALLGAHPEIDPRVVDQPHLLKYWNQRPDYVNRTPAATDWGVQPRGDIACHLSSGSFRIFDLVITNSTASSTTQNGAKASETAGAAALGAYAKKQAKYTARFAIEVGEFVPLAIEVGGRFHPGVAESVEEVIADHVTATSGRDRNSWVESDVIQFRTSVKYVLTALSFAVARSMALTLLNPRVVEQC
jgi:hypothetical protein